MVSVLRSRARCWRLDSNGIAIKRPVRSSSRRMHPTRPRFRLPGGARWRRHLLERHGESEKHGNHAHYRPEHGFHEAAPGRVSRLRVIRHHALAPYEVLLGRSERFGFPAAIDITSERPGFHERPARVCEAQDFLSLGAKASAPISLLLRRSGLALSDAQ